VNEERKGCLRRGCLGCAIVLGVGLLGVVAIGVLALVDLGREPDAERPELTQQVPARERPELPLFEEGGIVTLPELTAAVEEPGRVILDLSMGSFRVEAGRPGEPIRVDGDYDANRYTLEQGYETYGERGWVYRLRFGRKGGLLGLIGGSSDERIRLVLPPDVPIALEGRVRIGESRLELGGLWLVAADLDLGLGEHELSFDSPLPAPMERFRVKGGMGELRIRGLGNASPRVVEASARMGQSLFDLGGRWVCDSEVSLSCGMGECDVRVPEGVAIDHHISFGMGEKSLRGLRDLPEPGPGVPAMRLTVSGGMGQLRID
jgi:hypothetical protein